jgi:hypothetical protein
MRKPKRFLTFYFVNHLFKFNYEKPGGPHALRGGAKPQVKGVYPPEALRVQNKRYVFSCVEKYVDIV